MNDAAQFEAANPWGDAQTALALLAVDPWGLGGVNLRGPAGPVRDRWLDLASAVLPGDARPYRVPATITQGRLVGGLDLAATLAAGRPVAEHGLLAQADGGTLVLAMAERTSAMAASQISAACDAGFIRIERDGLAFTAPSRFALVMLDEGEGDERAPSKLLDRVAFHLDLTRVAPRGLEDGLPDASSLEAARTRVRSVEIDDQILTEITAIALGVGVTSLRPVLFAVAAARAAAALAGRSGVSTEDAKQAVALVLGPRALYLPQAPDSEQPPPQPEPQPQPEPPPQQSQPEDTPSEDTPSDEETKTDPEPDLNDMLLEAVKAAIPAGLLAKLNQGLQPKVSGPSQGRSGAEHKSARGGRPVGVMRGDPRQGARLSVVDTLRASAPWQKLRQRSAATQGPVETQRGRRIEVRRSDFHVKRTRAKSETATIFVVDASGSSALNRLAEAKGAVELLLADCYIRRDQVAMLAFRGTKAEILLPPTRSLVRAKRSLAGLPGGGATPLATALDGAATLADQVRRKGQTPTIVLLTDGRANIARDGTAGRPQAEADAEASARALSAFGIATLLIDTSPKPHPNAQRLATAMNALYLALPYADAARVSQAVRATRAR